MKEIKSKNIVKCPKCEKEATLTTVSQQLVAAAIICLLSFGITVWIPVIGWFLAPILILISIVLILAGIVAKTQGNATIACKECNSKFKINKEEYKTYKSSL